LRGISGPIQVKFNSLHMYKIFRERLFTSQK
jgi:hypothetical protein